MKPKELLETLEPIMPSLVRCVCAGCDEFESYAIPVERRPVVDGAPSGIMIWHLIWDHLEQEFGCDGDVRVIHDDGLPVLFVDAIGAGIRVNKLESETFQGPVVGAKHQIRRHPQSCFSFYDEQPPGHLTLGYTKRFEDGIYVLDHVVLTLQGEEQVQWTAVLYEKDRRGQAPTPPQRERPKQPTVHPRLRERKLDAGK